MERRDAAVGAHDAGGSAERFRTYGCNRGADGRLRFPADLRDDRERAIACRRRGSKRFAAGANGGEDSEPPGVGDYSFGGPVSGLGRSAMGAADCDRGRHEHVRTYRDSERAERRLLVQPDLRDGGGRAIAGNRWRLERRAKQCDRDANAGARGVGNSAILGPISGVERIPVASTNPGGGGGEHVWANGCGDGAERRLHVQPDWRNGWIGATAIDRWRSEWCADERDGGQDPEPANRGDASQHWPRFDVGRRAVGAIGA